MNQKEKEIKSKLRLDINRTLLAVSFTVFALIISINPSILQDSFLISLQLTFSIPLFLSSIFARSKLAYTKKSKMWESYGFIAFLLGYAFLINVIGNLISISAGYLFSLFFFGANIILPIIYSSFEVVEDKHKLWSRIKKDFLFIIILVIGGILPVINFY